jgi:CheY-like chemotaxis protein
MLTKPQPLTTLPQQINRALNVSVTNKVSKSPHSISVPNPVAKTGSPDRLKKIRLLLVDDHPVVRKGVASCLSRHPRLEIVAEADDGVEAVRMAKELRPDMVLTDIDMPNMNGLAVAETLHRELPQIKGICAAYYPVRCQRLCAQGSFAR